ncbi:MAG: AraC family transcriptional regulator [Bacteroidota bacterium]
MEDSYKYLSEIDDYLGLKVITCGYQHVGVGEPYPKKEHPKSHYFYWEKGRRLAGCYLIYIPTGRGSIDTQNMHRNILPGDVIKLYPGEWHRYRPDVKSGWEEYWIGFEGSAFDEYLSKSLFAEEKSSIVNIGHHDDFIYLFNQAITISRKYSSAFNKLLTGIVFQLVGYLDTPVYHPIPGKKDNYVYEHTLSKIRQELKEGIDFHDLAKQLGMSYSHFRKLFKARSGFSPQDFLINERLEYAKRLIKSSDLNIKEIALKCGFNSIYYFSRLFKERTGYSPKYYRNY